MKVVDDRLRFNHEPLNKPHARSLDSNVKQPPGAFGLQRHTIAGQSGCYSISSVIMSAVAYLQISMGESIDTDNAI